MAKSTNRESRPVNDGIEVDRFKDIQIRFPGDVYIVAVWLAMRDRSISTPTSQAHTTLFGLACKLAFLHGNSVNAEDVMAVFRQHGITGNPKLLHDGKKRRQERLLARS